MGNRIEQDVNKRFDIARRRLEGRARGGQKSQQESLRRNLAATGALQSGAGLKIQAQQRQLQERDIADIGEGLEGQKLAETQRLKEVQGAKDFARGEREASQSFASVEALKGRDFAAGEAGKNRDFQSSEASKQRGFSQGLFDAEQAFKVRALKFEAGKFRQQMRLAKKQFKLDENISEFNKNMARKSFDKKGLIEGLLGSLGVNPGEGQGFGGLSGIAGVATLGSGGVAVGTADRATGGAVSRTLGKI
jgi:hypothetical protein